MHSEARGWDTFWKDARMPFSPVRRRLFRRFREWRLPPGTKVLDVGCGSGGLAQFWHQEGYHVTGLDFSDQALELASRKGVYCVKGDVTQGLPFEDAAFDLVYSDGLLEHFVHPEPVLREKFRVSRGLVVTLVPRNTIYNWVQVHIMRPPQEYKRTDREWVEMHQVLHPESITCHKVGISILMIKCQKGAKDGPAG